MLSLILLACVPPAPVATVPGATRLAELANGELIVGTNAGALWRLTSFGDAAYVGAVPGGAIVELVADPLGRYWARTDDGVVHEGGLWFAPAAVGRDARLLVRGCEDTRWVPATDAEPGVTALALGHGCDVLLRGTQTGEIGEERVSDAAIVRLQDIDGGSLWVDAKRRAGCHGCEAAVPVDGVVDAARLHLAPFVEGEVAWLDEAGGVWIAGP